MTLQAFAQLGICKELLDSIERLNWTEPSEIQKKAIPPALRGKDVVGLAETGSGKTASFALPILQDLIRKPKHNFALVLTPTRELALQLKAQFLELGEIYGLKVACLVGGQHIEDQVRDLKATKYHIIIGTPGRLVFHLENTKELKLNRIRHFVLDEADQMLDDTFESQLQFILEKLPSNYRAHLYSATLSPRVQKIQQICTRSPVVIEVCSQYSRVEKLDHAFVFIPDQERDAYLVHLLISATSKTAQINRTIVFTTTWRESYRLAALLKTLSIQLGSSAEPLNGAMQQDKRQATLFNFRSGKTTILVATDLASRGLDIPDVGLVINYDVPRRTTWSESAKAYVHRVGRTARAGRHGRAITLVTPYSATRLKAVEAALGEQIPQLPWPGTSCISSDLRTQVALADRQARASLRSKDRRKRDLKRKRAKQQQHRTEACADPVPMSESSASDNDDA